MKLVTGLILILFAGSLLAENKLSSTEKNQRKLVSRFYEALELFPNRCPEPEREEYLNSVLKFETAYPEFISLTKGSRFRAYAINNFSNNTSSISKEACLYFKEALDAQVNTVKGQEGMSENTKIMRKNGQNI